MLKDWMEEHIDQTLQPFKDGLSATKTVVVDGKAVEVPDWTTRLAAGRELMDRGYGRPKQTVDAVVVSDEDLLERLAAMEGELADLGHSGIAGDDPEVQGDEAEA